MCVIEQLSFIAFLTAANRHICYVGRPGEKAVPDTSYYTQLISPTFLRD